MPKDGRNSPKRRADRAGRAYAGLTKADGLSMERGLGRNEGCRAMASDLGRSPSTVHDEVARHGFVWAPRARGGEPAPDDLAATCPRPASWWPRRWP